VREYRFAEFLTESFSALHRELPDVHARMCRLLCPREVHLDVGGEGVSLRFDDDAAVFLEGPLCPAIHVRTSRAAILALVDARSTLIEAVMSDELSLVGTPVDLLRFHDGLMTYLHGAVRAPSFPDLLRRFRQPALLMREDKTF